MGRFNKRKAIVVRSNFAGGISYGLPAKEELAFAVVSTFLKDEFYESGSDRIQRIADLVAVIGKKDPQFIAKLALVTRKEFHIRSAYHVLVGELAKIHRGDSLVKDLILESVERPDDLIEIASYLGKPLPNQVKKGIAEILTKFSVYQLAKYRSEGKECSLIDLFNLVHPKPKDKKQEKLFKDLMTGKLKSFDTWETRLSNEKDKGKVWQDLISEDKIGYMALLRNLRNIDEQANEKTKKMACKIIEDKKRVEESKQLPFRFYSAYKEVSNQDMLEAIAKALEHSLSNMPKLKGKTLIGIDVSGSMKDRPIEIASIFGSCLFKASNADMVLYDEKLQVVKALRSMPTIELADKIQKMATGGGTHTSLVFQHAHQSKLVYDRIIILSDNESWQEGYYGSNVQEEYKSYIKSLNIDPVIFAFDIQGYGTTDLRKSNRVFHISGWSDKVLDFINVMENKNIVDYIENYNKESGR